MNTEIIRTESEIESLIDWCMEKSHYAGMTYEDGIRAAIEWMTDKSADSPAE